MRYITTLSILASALILANCASYDFSRRNVQQGNLLPEAKIAQLRTGMSKDEVELLLGTSLLRPTFTDNRIDYAYTNRKGLGPMTIKKLSLYFNNGRLVRWAR